MSLHDDASYFYRNIMELAKPIRDLPDSDEKFMVMEKIDAHDNNIFCSSCLTHDLKVTESSAQ